VKKCTKCGEVKEVAEFAVDKHAKSGRRADCKQCNNRYRAGYVASPEGKAAIARYYMSAEGKAACARANARRRGHNVLPEEKAALIAQQGGVCAACKKPFGEGFWGPAVDHHHDTGVVRAVLHIVCNSLEGLYANYREQYDGAKRFHKKHQPSIEAIAAAQADFSPATPEKE